MGTAGRIILCDTARHGEETSLNEFANVRKDGIIAITIEPGDTLIDVKLTRGSIVEQDEVQDPGDDVVLITHDGMSIRFSESDVRSMGRSAAGVKGITLEKGDQVVALAVVVPDAMLLVAGENGIGKRTPFDEYLVQAESGSRKQSRGGKGRITMKVTEKTGAVVGALTVRDADEIMLITTGGQMVRIFVKDIREAGRNTQGVKLINLAEGDKLQAIAPVISEQQEDAAVGQGRSQTPSGQPAGSPSDKSRCGRRRLLVQDVVQQAGHLIGPLGV